MWHGSCSFRRAGALAQSRARGAKRGLDMMRSVSRSNMTLLALASLACSGDGEKNASSGNMAPEPGNSVHVALDGAVWGALSEALTLDRDETALSLAERYAVPFTTELGYAPLEAAGLDRVSEAMLTGLNGSTDGEALERLGAAGFVINPSLSMPSFPLGYSYIYSQHLPVFISADMVLEAVHRSYDDILVALEREVLAPRLERLLDDMARRLDAGALDDDPELAGDVRFFLGVGRALSGAADTSAFGSEVEGLVKAARGGAGIRDISLFGVQRSVDFSQFRPRGHYAGDAALEKYFRAMMWLGRTNLRLIETLPDGSRVFRRRQLEVAYGLRELLSAEALDAWRAIDRAIGAFAGEHDDMTLLELDTLSADLGVDARAGLATLDDDTIARAIVAGNYGQQRIASQVMRRDPGSEPLPLDSSFALFGQRYTVDSHVFSHVVYDRAPRVVPDPLDVAFGALANDQAVSLLSSELAQYAYASQLARVRTLVGAHPAEYWESSLYTSWLGALRALSPAADTLAAGNGLPSVARTELWGRRVLNTQLASWAQLRHNTVLYVKQSYTSNVACEFPDAYVDPYPQFFYGIAALAERGRGVVADIGWGSDALGARVDQYFAELGRVSAILGDMAAFELTGTPFTAEQLAFVNEAISVDANCDGTVLGQRGWYARMYFDPLRAVELDPTITDVHTDIGGDLPIVREPSVLHVGVGLPRAIVLTVDSCTGPRAYAGFVSAFHQDLASGLVRHTDEEWRERLSSAAVDDPGFVTPILAP